MQLWNKNKERKRGKEDTEHKPKHQHKREVREQNIELKANKQTNNKKSIEKVYQTLEFHNTTFELNLDL